MVLFSCSVWKSKSKEYINWVVTQLTAEGAKEEKNVFKAPAGLL